MLVEAACKNTSSAALGEVLLRLLHELPFIVDEDSSVVDGWRGLYMGS
jgi:hypothetical protein